MEKTKINKNLKLYRLLMRIFWIAGALVFGLGLTLNIASNSSSDIAELVIGLIFMLIGIFVVTLAIVITASYLLYKRRLSTGKK
jgi:hypothetical protein